MITVKEQEVIDHLILGASNKEIARALKVSPRTIDVHVANIAKKLGANNRVRIVYEAVSHGLAKIPSVITVIVLMACIDSSHDFMRGRIVRPHQNMIYSRVTQLI